MALLERIDLARQRTLVMPSMWPISRRLILHCCGLLFLMLVFLTAHPEAVSAKPETSKEYQIKAAFLFNFAQFVEWPSSAFQDASTPLCIGILGDDPFGVALDETIRGETIRNRKLVIRRSHRVEDLKKCHLLFVSRSEKERIGEILSSLNPAAVLTVSEVDGFARRGGILNFYLEGNKVRFEINPTTAERQHLKLSSQLLSLGKIVPSDR